MATSAQEKPSKGTHAMDCRLISPSHITRALGSKLLAVVAAAVLIAPIASAQDANVSRDLAELEFAPIGDLPIQIAVLWGNPQECPSAFMLKYPPGFPGGMHIHTNAYHAVVVSGAVKHWVKGDSEDEARLHVRGDYWYQQGGEWHQDSFPTDEETILFVKFDGISDTTFAE